ncbi:Copper transporter like [Actinidia chinensis var. chinensis]|uniref:Copper transport protein n=1 Tax=Actinidia chinensis var. chinensis TaxID=1590841 RepID=A0A2R6RRN3_ACTCC|nr:Copper transporter like [Actinidia chinensis var. chinensis]
MSHQHDMPMPMPMPMSPGSMSNNDTMNMKDMVMHMSFYWGKDATILFQGWPNHSLPMYILSLFFVFLLSLATEVLSVSPAAAKQWTSPVAGGLIQAGVYALRTALAYMVMLSVMSFNLGIFVVAVAGHTVGFFLVKCRAAAAREEDATGFTPKV